MKELVFLKLGGSLITDKSTPYTPLLDRMDALALQIKSAQQTRPNLRLLIGHGAGSFGHVPAREYKTRDGLPSTGRHGDAQTIYWKGFVEVRQQAAALNQFVMDALYKADVRAIALPPSASVAADNGSVAQWELTPIRMALAAQIVPVIFGDTVFDRTLGGTILSTEDLFMHLTDALRPDRILLAGLEAAVWEDFPARARKVETITPASFNAIEHGIGASAAADVTGGMESKVRQMLDLVERHPNLTAQIFSGERAGNLLRALEGETLGTIICADEK